MCQRFSINITSNDSTNPETKDCDNIEKESNTSLNMKFISMLSRYETENFAVFLIDIGACIKKTYEKLFNRHIPLAVFTDSKSLYDCVIRF